MHTFQLVLFIGLIPLLTLTGTASLCTGIAAIQDKSLGNIVKIGSVIATIFGGITLTIVGKMIIALIVKLA